MAYPSVTHTFTTGGDLDATQVNTNFTNIIDGVTDGKKDLNVADLNLANITASTTMTTNDVTATSATIASGTIGIISSTDIFSTILSLVKESKTIAGDSVTPTKSLVELNGEAGGADNLQTIVGTNFSTGDLLMLFKTAASGNITIKHNTGNILCGSDKTLSSDSIALLIYDGTAAKWHLLFHQTN